MTMQAGQKKLRCFEKQKIYNEPVSFCIDKTKNLSYNTDDEDAVSLRRGHRLKQEDTIMPLVTSEEMLSKAQKGGYAVGAFNVENMEMVKAVIAAAED